MSRAIPEVWVSICRSVMRSPDGKPGMNRPSESLVFSLPCCSSRRMAAAVNSLEIDPIRKRVSARLGTANSRLAIP
jgi:hypothetical protein